MLRLGLRTSHRGSNAQAIVNAYREGRLGAEPAVIVSNNANAPVLRIAADAGIPHSRIGGPAFADTPTRDSAILGCLHDHSVDLVVLAGYMKLLGHGATLAQRRVPVEPDDSADSLCARVQSQERLFLVEPLQAIATGALKLPAS